MGKKALVIGGTGFLGAAIVKELHQNGWEVSALSRGNSRQAVEFASFIRADRTVPNALESAVKEFGFDLVVDCAAYHRQDVVDALNVFQGKVSHYIFISTDYIYAADSKAIYPLSEDALIHTETSYAKGKVECEQTLQHAFEQHQFPITILRPPHIMGAGKGLGNDISQGRDAKLLEYIRTGKGLTLLAEGQLLIQPVLNREVGACIAHIAENPATFGQIFNCAGSECVTSLRYYQMIADYVGVPLSFESISLTDMIIRNPGVTHYARHRIYDLGRLRTITGYHPQYGIQEAIVETAAWMET